MMACEPTNVTELAGSNASCATLTVRECLTVAGVPITGGGGGGVGPGTPNRVAKFTGAATVGDSQTIDDGTNVTTAVGTGGQVLTSATTALKTASVLLQGDDGGGLPFVTIETTPNTGGYVVAQSDVVNLIGTGPLGTIGGQAGGAASALNADDGAGFSLAAMNAQKARVAGSVSCIAVCDDSAGLVGNIELLPGLVSIFALDAGLAQSSAISMGNGEASLGQVVTGTGESSVVCQGDSVALKVSTGGPSATEIAVRLGGGGVGEVLIGLPATPTQRLGFFGSVPVVRPVGVAVNVAAIHAALVALGLIT
jgi:hypothetical protein